MPTQGRAPRSRPSQGLELKALQKDGGRGIYASKSYKETEHLVRARTDDSEAQPGWALW